MKSSSFRRFIGIVLSILFCISATVLTALVSISTTLEKDNLCKIFTDEKISGEILKSDTATEIIDNIGEKLRNENIIESEKTDDTLMVLNEAAANILSDKLVILTEKIISNTITEEDITEITAEIFEENFDTLTKNEKIEFNEETKKEISEYIKTSPEIKVAARNGISEIKTISDTALFKISYDKIPKSITVVSIITAIIAIFIILLFSKTRSFGLWFGINFTITGIIFVLISSVSVYAETLLEVFGKNLYKFKNIILLFAENIFSFFGYAAIISIAAAFIFYIIYAVMRPAENYNQKRKGESR